MKLIKVKGIVIRESTYRAEELEKEGAKIDETDKSERDSNTRKYV